MSAAVRSRLRVPRARRDRVDPARLLEHLGARPRRHRQGPHVGLATQTGAAKDTRDCHARRGLRARPANVALVDHRRRWADGAASKAMKASLERQHAPRRQGRRGGAPSWCLPPIQTVPVSRSRSATRTRGISEVRAVASASAHTAGWRVSRNVACEQLRHNATSSSVSARSREHSTGEEAPDRGSGPHRPVPASAPAETATAPPNDADAPSPHSPPEGRPAHPAEQTQTRGHAPGDVANVSSTPALLHETQEPHHELEQPRRALRRQPCQLVERTRSSPSASKPVGSRRPNL